MSIAPFSPHPAHAPADAQGSWRTRLAVASATVGIAATVLAYAISADLRHAVSHAEHSVGHAVSRVFDHDTARKGAQRLATRKPAPARRTLSTHTRTASPARSPSSGTRTSSTR
jgi:hypothetical protein